MKTGLGKIPINHHLGDLAYAKVFESDLQEITAAGTLTIYHTLGRIPKITQLELVCQVANLNYAIGDVVPISVNDMGSSRGVSVIPDATKLTLRYGSAANTFSLLNATTGASGNITNSSWKLRVRVFA